MAGAVGALSLIHIWKLSVAPEDFSDVVQEGNMAFFMKLSELCGSGAKANRGLSAVYVEKELIQTCLLYTSRCV